MKVLIVDDEAPARDRLRQLTQDLGDHTIVGEAGNGRQALDLAAQLAPDVVLLDIRMPGLNGIETAHHFNRLEHPPAVIFTTAYDEYAIDAFEAHAIGYVLKPVRRERLKSALHAAARLNDSTLAEVADRSGVSGKRKHVCAHVQGELKLIALEDIAYFVADQKYVRVHHDRGQDLIDDSLKTLEMEFADEFVRIHRSALVAVARIESLKKSPDGQVSVTMRDAIATEESLAISRRHLATVRRRIKKG